MLVVIVLFGDRAYPVTVKEDHWITWCKVEIVRQLRLSYPSIFGHMVLNVNHLKFCGECTSIWTTFPVGFVADSGFRVYADLSLPTVAMSQENAGYPRDAYFKLPE